MVIVGPGPPVQLPGNGWTILQMLLRGTKHQGLLFPSRYLLNEGTAERKKTSLRNVHGHGFIFSFKSNLFQIRTCSSSKGGRRAKAAAVFMFIKWGNNRHPTYLQIQMACYSTLFYTSVSAILVAH